MASVGQPYQSIDADPSPGTWNWDLEKKPALILIISGLLGWGIGYGLDRYVPNVIVESWLYLGWMGVSVLAGALLWLSPGVRRFQRQISGSLLVLGYLLLILIGFWNRLPPTTVALLTGAQLLLALSFPQWVEYTLFALVSLGVYLFSVLNLEGHTDILYSFMGLMVSSTLAGGLFTWWRVGRLAPETPADQLISHLMDQDEDALFLLDYDGDRIVFQNYAAVRLLVQLGIPAEVEGQNLLEMFGISLTYMTEHMQDTPPGQAEKQYLQKSDATNQEMRLEVVLSKLPLPEMPYYRLQVADITARVQREHRIRRNLSIHQSLLQAMPDLLVSIDRHDHILTLHAPRPMRERARLDHFEGQPASRLMDTFLDGQQQRAVWDLIQAARKSGQLRRTELRFELEDSSIYYFDLRLQRMQQGDELLGILQDITQSRQAQLALQRSENNYQQVFNSGKAGIMILDQDTFRPIDVNARAAALLGYRSADLLRRSILDLIEPEAFELFTEYLSEAFERLQHFDTQLLSAQGVPIAVEMQIKHVHMDGHERLMITFDDIADRIDRRRALEESEQRYRTLVENMQEGLILTDENDRVLFVNHRMQQVLDMHESQMLGRRIQEILDCPLEDHAEANELRFERSQGGPVWLMVSRAPYTNGQGEVLGSLAVITDITANKQAALKLREKNSELDAFIYKASHDLRGPLASIIGVANLARTEVSEEAALRYLSLIGKSTKKLDIILNELLDATRIKKAPLKFEQVDVQEVLTDAFDGLTHLMNGSRVRLQQENHLQASIRTDAHLLHSILQNLLVNGITYANPEAEDPYVKVTVDQVKDKLEIEVEDNGQGIAPRVLPKVFEMFYRGSNQSKGSGLGLYIVKNAVEKLNGQVTVDSQEGKGSKFSLILPIDSGNSIAQE